MPGITSLFARPQLLLRSIGLLILFCALGCVFLALGIPQSSVEAVAAPAGRIDLIGERGAIGVAGESTVRFRSAITGDSVSLPASLLTAAAEPQGNALENARYWTQRDRLAAMLRVGPVDIMAEGRTLRAVSFPRTLPSLSVGFWLSLVAGAVAALAGVWVWILRPMDWAPVMFALSGIGLFAGCATIAVKSEGGFAEAGSLDHALIITNYVAGVLCAGALVALFARFPVVLIGRAALWIFLLIHTAIAFLLALELSPAPTALVQIFSTADCVAIVALLAMQAWLARRDPRQRAMLLPIALGTIIAGPLFLVLSMGWQSADGRPIVNAALTAPLFLLIYLGLGLSVARARLFALGSGALSLLISACAVLLTLIIDPIVLATVTRERDQALLIAAFLGVAAYLPAREWLLRRAERLRDRQAQTMLQHATDIAMAVTPEAATTAWGKAVATMFDAVDVTAALREDGEPRIEEAGASLYLPAPIGGHAMRLRHPQGGTRPFGADDLVAAHQFNALVERLVEARDGYMRGVRAERARIARDLHDDVSARLLTCLHRSDPALMQDDVRGAMSDIRAIVSDLTGDAQCVEDILADLRHETQNRLEAAGIALDWPLHGDASAPHLLPGHFNRQVGSIIRECVTNIIRHAGAKHVRVTVTLDDRQLVVAIADDGLGLGTGKPSGNGIANARRRAAELGGTFDVAMIEGWATGELSVPVPSTGYGQSSGRLLAPAP